MKKRVIWTNLLTQVDEDGIVEGFCEDNEITSDGLTEENKHNIVYDYIDDWLKDERCNLNIQLENPILVVAHLGMWNKSIIGYKIIDSGNIKDILYEKCCESCEWYSDGYNVKFVGYHHDGMNTYEYREIKNMDNIDRLLNDLYHGKQVTRKRLNYYTKSILPEVNKIYGWK